MKKNRREFKRIFTNEEIDKSIKRTKLELLTLEKIKEFRQTNEPNRRKISFSENAPRRYDKPLVNEPNRRRLPHATNNPRLLENLNVSSLTKSLRR